MRYTGKNGWVTTTITGAFDCYGRVGWPGGGGGTLFNALGRLCISTMDLKPPMTMIREEPPSDFEVAKRAARRLWGFSDSAISFASSSEATRVEFVTWVKAHLRRIEKKGSGARV